MKKVARLSNERLVEIMRAKKDVELRPADLIEQSSAAAELLSLRELFFELLDMYKDPECPSEEIEGMMNRIHRAVAEGHIDWVLRQVAKQVANKT